MADGFDPSGRRSWLRVRTRTNKHGQHPEEDAGSDRGGAVGDPGRSQFARVRAEPAAAAARGRAGGRGRARPRTAAPARGGRRRFIFGHAARSRQRARHRGAAAAAPRRERRPPARRTPHGAAAATLSHGSLRCGRHFRRRVGRAGDRAGVRLFRRRRHPVVRPGRRRAAVVRHPRRDRCADRVRLRARPHGTPRAGVAHDRDLDDRRGAALHRAGKHRQ